LGKVCREKGRGYSSERGGEGFFRGYPEGRRSSGNKSKKKERVRVLMNGRKRGT